MGDARADLDDSAGATAASGTAAPAKPAVVTWLPWTVTALALAVAIWASVKRPPGTAAVVDGHFTIELPGDAPLVINDAPKLSVGPLAVSPDGRHMVYVAPQGHGTQLYVRAMNDETPRALAGTDGASFPFFSPDGQWVGFFADGKLKKTALAGGSPATLADASDGTGGSWGSDGEIVYGPTPSGLFAVRDTGGTPRRLTSLDAARGEDVHILPQVLPDRDTALFTVLAWSREATEIALVDLKTGARRVVQEDASYARYVPAAHDRGGHLVFVRDGALLAAPFDPARAEPAGAAVAVLDHVRGNQFEISASGMLAYAPRPESVGQFSLVWVDRAGNATPINDLQRGYEDLHLSPDGRRVVLTIEEPGAESPAHVWLADTVTRTLSRFTFDGFSRDPVWAPHGESIVFGSKRGKDTYGLYVQRLDGRAAAERAWASPNQLWPDPQSWTPDGRTIIFTTQGRETGADIWALSLADRTAQPWLATAANEVAGRLSPDGKWMAYFSDASGRYEVYVQPFPGPGAKRLVSQDGGLNPIWSRDGREIFFRHDRDVLAVKFDPESESIVGAPAVMFSGRYRLSGRDFDVSPDGTRFVMIRVDGPRTGNSVRVVLDWRRALEARVKGTRYGDR